MFGLKSKLQLTVSAEVWDAIALTLLNADPQQRFAAGMIDMTGITLVRGPDEESAPPADDPIARHNARVLAPKGRAA